jgi:hypothetical protein
MISYSSPIADNDAARRAHSSRRQFAQQYTGLTTEIFGGANAFI